MWQSLTKKDLAIEVWEKLDCESIGQAEIEAIETVLKDTFHPAPIESPMTIARWLADEGAELRHKELMSLYVTRAENRPYAAALRQSVDTSSFAKALSSLTRLENLRRKYKAESDKEGLHHLSRIVIEAKKDLVDHPARDAGKREQDKELVEWLKVWLQTPEIFSDWVGLRMRSPGFTEQFGTIDEEGDK